MSPKRKKTPDIPRVADAIKLPEILPCPCCGEVRNYFMDDALEPHGLYVGCMSATSYGVRCASCGMKSERDWMGCDWGRIRDMNVIFKWTLKTAIEAWNTRAPLATGRLTATYRKE